MATSLSNISPFAPCIVSSPSSSSSKPFKTLTFKCLHHPPKPSFSRHLSRITTNRSRTTSHATNGRKEGDLKDANDLNGEGGRRYPTDAKTLIRVYQEAFSNGDEKAVAEIEAIICSIEKEKNRLDQKFLSLAMEITSGKEKYIQLQADFDNFRKRFETDRLTTQSNARRRVIESLLPMVDSFEGARQQIKPETEKENKIYTSYQGIYKQFVEVLRSLHVSAIATVGKPFDPSLHEAIAREESQKFKEGIVIQELRRGFLLGDRLLRPAKVKVSAGPSHKKSPLATEQSSAGQPATTAGVDEQ